MKLKTTVFINDFIAVRGRSGSSRGSALISSAIKESADTRSLSPQREPASRIARLLNMVCWDFIFIPVRSMVSRAAIVVHCTNTGISGYRVPSIVVMHDTMVLDHPKLFSAGYVIYARVAFWLSVRYASLVVTPSDHSRQRILVRWPKAAVQVIPWPVFPGLEEMDSRPGPRSKNVLIVSSIDKHKRLGLAVEAVARLRESSTQDFKAVFVTRPGNDMAAFNAALDQFDPDRLWTSFLTRISDDELVEAYRTSYCLLVSSIDEGFCLPAAEASLAGIPVAHTGRGAMSEVVALNQNVRVAPVDDLESLVEQLDSFRAAGVWQQLSQQGLYGQERFSPSLFRDRWGRAIKSVMETT